MLKHTLLQTTVPTLKEKENLTPRCSAPANSIGSNMHPPVTPEMMQSQ
jgi:hypothetical protein